jgi:hypothetical protein
MNMVRLPALKAVLTQMYRKGVEKSSEYEQYS